MTIDRKHTLLASTAVALSIAVAGPVWAKAAPKAGEAAPLPVGFDLNAQAGKGGGNGGKIRPFGEKPATGTTTTATAAVLPAAVSSGANRDRKIRPFSTVRPNWGRIRTFAGDLGGTSEPVQALWGRIRTFAGEGSATAGEVTAQWRRIRTFSGDLRTFSGQVNTDLGPDAAFWGGLQPAGTELTPLWRRIRTFSGEFEAISGRIGTLTGGIRTSTGAIARFDQAAAAYNGLSAELDKLATDSETAFGEAYRARTGLSFRDGFAAKMFAKYGITPGDATTLVGLNEVGVELFLLDWHDNLNNFSGQDQVDHWMKAVRWSPALTQNMGQGLDTKIGVLDFGIAGGDAGVVVGSAGQTTAAGANHGAAVASLIAGRHDGRGVMGIAPTASVVGYNPFDATGTAGWADIRAGVNYLFGHADASGKTPSVINASLGVPGGVLHSGWYDQVFQQHDKDSAFARAARAKILVVAAGNDGVVHHKDDKIRWDWEKMPNVLIVGSVDPNNNISDFSNRPGEGEFDKKGGNDPVGGDKLRDRFIVAPGEWMLVSDGQGGVTRMSGTSFAAPLVSGTIALIHDRWPWLANHSKDTVNIILDSARDLGADGTDFVYGVGMLDVEAALSPINWNDLKFYRSTTTRTSSTEVSRDAVLKTSATTRATWEANNVYFHLFEDTGDSFRDFNVPMSSKLLGRTVGSANEQFNAYLQGRFWNWFNAGGKCSNDTDYDCDGVDDGKSGDKENFTNLGFAARIAGVGGMDATAYAVPRTYRAGLRQDGAPFDTSLALRSPDGRFGLKFGGGSGVAMTGIGGFGLQSDYDADTGGANPFLGMASGAGFAAAELRLADGLTVQVGASRDDQRIERNGLTLAQLREDAVAGRFQAGANTMTLAWAADKRFTATLGYTMLQERSSLLGVRSLDTADLPEGTTTDAATFGADWRPGRGLTVSLAGSMGRTRAGAGNALTVAEGGLYSSAWQAAVAKQGVLGRSDRLRVSIAQPLHIEAGRLAYTGVRVVDRMTGEIGTYRETFSIDGGQRRFVTEALYGGSIGDGAAEFNLFGRADLGADDAQQARLTMGGSFRLAF